jgi:hypothetical protein
MDEAIADQKDYMFFSRVLKGISDSQGCSHSHNFILQNQSLVSHLIHTRQDVDVTRRPQHKELSEDWTPGLSSNEPFSSRAAFLHNVTASALAELEDDEEGIFDLEL